MKIVIKKLFFVLCFCVSSFSQTAEVVFIQLNDVYEIAPLEGGKFGGLARVSSIIKEHKAKNPYTFVVLSGDFISPSALGTSEYEGKRINGRQMVDVLNAVGIDFVTFGNHEFDYKYEVLQERINESKFEWISSNVLNFLGDARFLEGEEINIKFGKNDTGSVQSVQIEKNFITIAGISAFPEYKILKIPGYLKNSKIKIGLIGLCIDANKQSYVHYENYVEAGKRVYSQIKDSIDYLLGITHLSIDEDKNLASQLPQLRLIMGGHEHVNMYHKVGETVIAKADANARTVYIHTLSFDESNKLINMKSDLLNIDSTVAEDPKVKELVDEWTTRAFKGFIDKGFDPLVMVYDLKSESLDGREETVRYELCPLGVLIAMAMLDASKGSDCAVFNSGAIRIDDELKGEVTQYDIIRVLPFGGKILQVEMKGSLLRKIMETGWNNKGNGGFLQFYGIEQAANGWKTRGGFIDDNKIYNIAVSDFLLSGMEQNFGYLTKDNPSIIEISEPDPADKSDLRNDIRFAVINYLKKWNR
jgi:2',3'-cyclic-nucleotide 2'-phosphodiesterase (5'-nucleotidase family)